MQPNRMKLTVVCAMSAACCLSSSAYAESGFRPAATAFVLDSRTQAIRPVIGQPGAWIQDQGLDIGMPVRAARFSLQRDFALIVGGAGGADTPVVAVVAGLKRGPLTVTPIEGALGSATLLVLNPVLNDDGTAGLLYSDDGRQVQFLQGLPAHPVVAGTVSLDQLPGTLTALALSGSGDLALVAMADETGGAVYRLMPGQAPEFVTPVQRASAIAFENDQNAFVADAGQILKIDARSGGGATLVAGSSRGIRQPQSLYVLSSTRILVGQTDDSSITCLDLNSGLDSVTVVPVPPASLDRFPENYFVLNQPGSGPVYVLETGALAAADCTQKIWFIPAD